MRKIKVSSRKYDGSLRDEYEAFLYAESDEGLVVYSPPGTLDYDYRKRVWSVAPDGLLELFFKTRWYIVQHICEQNSHFNQSYVHLAMPVTVTTTGLTWVDLDLDYRVHLDGRLERLDEPEYNTTCGCKRHEFFSSTTRKTHGVSEHKWYNEHKVSMGYPAEVQEQVQAACAESEALYQQQVYPFDYAAQVALYQLAGGSFANLLS